MNRKKTMRRIRYALQYSPFTFNAFLAGIVIWWCFHMLEKKGADADAPSSFEPFLLLMGKTALWFFTAVVLFSFLSTLCCYLYFLVIRKRRKTDIRFRFATSKQLSGIDLEAFLASARRPPLGLIKSRLVYDDFRLTDSFVLAGNRKQTRQFWREGIAGRQHLQLPDIKEYELKGSFLFFEDMLQLFSFPVYRQQQAHFFQAPEKQEMNAGEVLPRQTQNADIRIHESRPVPGDYLNYKHFESGDDIRRIVWKVYARNRELVVRIPEQRDVYASHIYFYASFHTDLPGLQKDSVFADELLNYFKNRVWTAFEALLRRNVPVRFIPDQLLHIPENMDQEASVQRIISNAQWQGDLELNDYFKSRYGAVICISSFNNPEEVARLLEECGKDTVIYYVPLSRAFRHFMMASWLERLFLKPPDDRLKRIRSRWIFTSLRIQLLKREKEIARLLDNSGAAAGIL